MRQNRQKICSTDWECRTISYDTYITLKTWFVVVEKALLKRLLRLRLHLVPEHGAQERFLMGTNVNTPFFYPLRPKAVFTLGARAPVPGHEHKMVLCSDTGYPISWSPVQCLNSDEGTWKKSMLTLVPFKNRSRAPCSGTKCECSLTYF